MTRILVLVTSLDRGGIEMMLMNYYRAMDRKRYQLDFLVNRSEEGAYEEEILSLGGRIFRIGPQYPWRYPAYWREMKRFLEEHPDYSIIHSHLEERSWLPLLVARRAGIPVRIAHIHNYYPWALDLKTPFRQAFRRLMQMTRAANYCFACSEVAGKWLFGRRKFTVVPDAIEIERFRFTTKKRAKIRAELGVDDDTLLLGQVGRLVPQKNPLFTVRLIRALARESAGKMVFVGKGELAGRIARAHVAGDWSIELVGQVGNVEEYFCAFDALLVPSRHEGFGMVVVDAGLTGLSVLASDRVPIEANVVKNTTFLPVDQLWPWVTEVEKLKRMSTRVRAEKSARAHEMARKKGFDVAQAVRELEKIYEEALDGCKKD